LKKIYGLIGNPLGHSFSADYFAEKFKREKISGCEYKLFPLSDISKIHAFVSEQKIQGFNVTIPYKTAIIPYLDKLSKEAGIIGAVNTVLVKQMNGKIVLEGFNTDATAFKETLTPLLKKEMSTALVLGNGGASKAVCYVLRELNISFTLVTRNPSVSGQISYPELTEKILTENLLIINTTSLGMFPEVNSFPSIPYPFLTPYHFAYDLVYNPEKTLFLQKCDKHGVHTKNGIEMFHKQAELSWSIWEQGENIL
jgi:shikimate dehydrogenase